ncbi:MAG: hypothetical protein ACI3VX_03915 [Faecousia sp.]
MNGMSLREILRAKETERKQRQAALAIRRSILDYLTENREL